MRQITRRRGKHLGTHYIFEDYSEAVKWLSGDLSYLNVNNQDLTKLDCFPPWIKHGVKENDWVTCDDGKIIQVLRIYRMKPGKKPVGPPYEIVNIKTVGLMGYYIHYLQNDYVLARCNFNITDEALADNRAKQTMGGRRSKHQEYVLKLKKMWKRVFVYYLVIYLSPVFAYQMMLRDRKLKQGQVSFNYYVCQKRAYELLKDQFVIRELESYMSIDTFRNRLSAALSKQGINEERIVDELSSGLEAVKKGTQTHKQFIELAVNISRYANDKENIGPDGKPITKIEAADYQETNVLPPPPLAIESIIDPETREMVYKSLGEVDTDVDSKVTSEPPPLSNELNEMDEKHPKEREAI